MDNLGDILGTIFGEGIFGEAFGQGEDRSERREAPVIVYERYLCGGPKYLNVNDR